MEIKNVQLIKPFGPLMMTAQMPEVIVKSLNDIVNVIKDNKDMGGRLAGQIKTESEIPHSMLEEKQILNVFDSFATNYVQQGYINAGQKHILDTIDIKTQMQSIWSVSQYENEYNPQHNHSNCQISAVLYLKIPTMTPRNIPDKQDKDGNIEFTFCNRDNIFTASSFVLEPQAGMLILFPNSLNHQVYPFQGSGERRSIAFNMSYKAFKKDSGIQILGDGVNMYNEINFPESIPWRRLENV
jgi:uncharacterized protein (TIGR02466 family)